jgi:predicted alpha/beta superfamily hydrolase
VRVLAALAFGFIPWLSWAAEPQDFSVEVETSPDDVVLVVGSAEELGAEDPLRAVMLAPQREGRWGGKIWLSAGTTGTYQYLKRRTGAEEFEDPKNVVFLGEPRVLQEVKGGSKAQRKELNGEGKLETPKYLDSPLKEFPGRMVRVWLPPGYDSGKERYPVVYFHDGQNVFDPGGPFGSWSADQVAEGEMRAGRVRPAILVGIDNTPDRVREYLPPQDVVPKGRPAEGEKGRADLYARYLLEVVKPHLDQNFRTSADRENTLALGASMGGVVSHYLMEKHGDVFGAAGIFSPAYWASPKYFAESLKKPKPAGRIYLDMGTREGRSYWPDVLRIYQHWVSGGAVIFRDVWFQPGIGAEHNEKAWKERLPAALRFLLPPETRAGS